MPTPYYCILFVKQFRDFEYSLYLFVKLVRDFGLYPNVLFETLLFLQNIWEKGSNHEQKNILVKRQEIIKML
jgi:hypothetical protein